MRSGIFTVIVNNEILADLLKNYSMIHALYKTLYPTLVLSWMCSAIFSHLSEVPFGYCARAHSSTFCWLWVHISSVRFAGVSEEALASVLVSVFTTVQDCVSVFCCWDTSKGLSAVFGAFTRLRFFVLFSSLSESTWEQVSSVLVEIMLSAGFCPFFIFNSVVPVVPVAKTYIYMQVIYIK